MAGDWAYDEPLPIAAAELTILGLAVALYANRRSHCLFPLPERPMASVCRLAAEVVHVVNRYSEVACGAMIAGEIVDKLLALPATVTRTVEMIRNPAQNCAKRESPRCSKCSISFTMRVARHDKLPK
jgi:hypothetical protein